jgi:hypothetical protein
MIILMDLANALTCVIAVIIALKFKLIPDWVGLIFIFYSFIPFFLNGVLFSANYLPDQFLYASTLGEIRSFNDVSDIKYKILITPGFLSILPLPYAESVSSMGFFNRFLFFILFIWLYKKNFLKGMPLMFILFYPSLILYTSLSLRDPLIMTLMVASVIFFIDKKYLFSIFFTIPLFFIKFQNFFLMIIFFAIFYLYNKQTLLFRSRYIIIAAIGIAIIPFLNEIIMLFDGYRRIFFLDDGGDIRFYEPITGLQDFFMTSITSGPYFLVKPFLWEVSGFFQLIQALENLFILIFLIFFTKRAYKISSFITNKWLIFFLIAIFVYGIIIFNFGTAARYRYPLIVVYVLGLSYELYKVYGYRYGKLLKL